MFRFKFRLSFLQELSLRRWHNLGIPKEKLILGIPLFGRSFLLASENQHTPGLKKMTNAEMNITYFLLKYFILVFFNLFEGYSAQESNMQVSLYKIQAALGICNLYICDFAYVRLRNGHFPGTYPQIYSYPWSFYMQIHYKRAYFLSPYLSLITRSTFIKYGSYA